MPTGKDTQETINVSLPKSTKHDPKTNSVIFAGNDLEFHLGMRDKYNKKNKKE